MKKRIYFIISSFLIFLLSVLSFLHIDNLVKNSIEGVKEAYASIPDLLNRILDVLENHGKTYLAVIIFLVLLISIILFAYTLKENHILKKKGLFIVLSLFGLLLSSNSIVGGLFLLNILVLFFSRRKDEEDFPVKKDIPTLEKFKVGKKEVIEGIILLGVYFSQFVWSRFLPESFSVKIIIQISFDFVVLVLAIWFFFFELKRDIKAWKGNSKAYLHYIFSKYGIGLLIYFGVSALCLSLTNYRVSLNQQGLNALPLWYVFPTAVLWAPIVEEILFRGVIRRFIKKDWLFIIVSAFVFGILHTFREDGIISILVMSFPYATLGAIFAYVYTKTENITCNMVMHGLHNLLGTLMNLFI